MVQVANNKIEDIKQISIVDYLQSRGIYGEVKGKKWFCSSPFARDSNWSFCVYPNNTFYCWSTGKAGDIIHLVQALENCGFGEAIRHLTNGKYESYKANYKQFKEDPDFWKDFDHTKYINHDLAECEAIRKYGIGRSIRAGYSPGVYFTRDSPTDTWTRNPALAFLHVDKDLKICGIKFRNIHANSNPRFSSRGRLGFYILDTETLIQSSGRPYNQLYGKRRIYLCESETSTNSLWEYLGTTLRIPATVISMGGVSSAPRELPEKFQNQEILLIIDYDGNEELYKERLEKYKHLNVKPIKLILPKGEDINSLYHQNKMYLIETILLQNR